MEPIFDISRLTDYELGHLEYMVNSPSYVRVVRPFLEEERVKFINLMLTPDPMIRKRYGGTKQLRADANAIARYLTFFDKILAETKHERAMKARELIGQEDIHAEAVKAGIIGQAGQDKRKDYPEDEEF